MAWRGSSEDPKVGGAARVAVPEPAPGAGHRRGVPGRRVLRRPRRGAGQVRDGAPRQRRRRTGDRDRGGVRVLPAVVLPRGRRAGGAPGWKGWYRPGPGPAAATSSPSRSWPGPSSSWRPIPALKPGRPGRADRRGVRGARAPPLRRASAGPPAGALQKPLTCPPPSTRKEENPSLSLRPSPGPAAAEPGPSPRAGCRPGSCSRRRAGRPLRATASCRPARTRERVPARARRAHRQGRHRLAARPGRPGPAAPARTPRSAPLSPVRVFRRRQRRLPGPVATELIHALAGLAIALAGT